MRQLCACLRHFFWGGVFGMASSESLRLTVADCFLQLCIICKMIREKCSDRLHGFLEGFAGEANLTSAMLSAGVRSKPTDLSYASFSDAPQDLTSAKGFRYWLLLLAFTLPGLEADQWHGIVCSSWVFISRSTSQRKHEPGNPTAIWGNEQRSFMRTLLSFSPLMILQQHEE